MSDMLSRGEIDALLNSVDNNVDDDENTKEELSANGTSHQETGDTLTDMELDTIGEIGNISMGSAATTLFALLGNRVQITTPKVSQTTISELAKVYQIPFVAVFVRYSMSIEGTNLLILKEDDVRVMTSLMMGGNGTSDLPEELTDMHLSALSEAMNQMMGAAATSLAEMIDKKVDISPPIVKKISLEDMSLETDGLGENQPVICTSFNMTVGNLIDSQIMQILPINFAKELVHTMIGDVEEKMDNTVASEPVSAQQSQPASDTQSQNQASQQPDSGQTQQYQAPQYQAPQYQAPLQSQVQVQPVQFSNFETSIAQELRLPENIDLIKDVMLKITVELGKTVKPINEILDFKPGSIVELDKLVGEPLDILANGKKIAMGEVVVIDENYGMRITDIVKQDKKAQ